MIIDESKYLVKIAQTDSEILAAQRLRYRVFVTEMGATVSDECHRAKREYDRFDPYFDHLILIDREIDDPDENVVGVYRLLPSDTAAQGLGFYGDCEYDFSPFTNSQRRSVELGRSCLAQGHRGGGALHLLWQGLGDYVAQNQIEILFGVASFAGIDAQIYAHALSHLHHNHLAPECMRPVARGNSVVDMNILPRDQVDRLAAMRQMPSLIKSYLRLGGVVGAGAFVDHAFNTIDVCMIMDTQKMPQTQRLRYAKGA
ncbi:GNAT family N-acetyltransferase [Amylibacter kogurei]|uniref:L-ornithine N(alpha)-acyltransferase n=1 Tax=Paramylibacter kogurei TaxID=1889778 RepID=A0A2G5K8U7_9RHOB|nr:GNAT family N-acyltransferase [Amylibacter kogurei]PIB25958.1 GNAT family N-acetyltransferase [Amylibacter kogurei]